MTTDTTPKPRVVRWEKLVSHGTRWVETTTPRAFELPDLRAIVAIPRRCTECDGSRREYVAPPDRDDWRQQPCSACHGSGYERCTTCAAHVVDQSLDLDIETRIIDPPCDDCIDGVLHDEHEVAVRDVLVAVAGVCERQGGDVHAAVLAALIGDREPAGS